MYSYKRQCAVCNNSSFDHVKDLLQHVEQAHPDERFSRKVRDTYIMDAVFAEVGFGQPWCWTEGLSVMIPELVNVFGINSAFAWYGAQNHRHGGPMSYKPRTYLEALQRACGLDDGLDDVMYAAAAEVDNA
jgi:hypothetical protein